MITQLINMKRGQRIDEEFLVPMLKWLSVRKENQYLCDNINKYFFNVDKEVLISMLNLNKKETYLGKYPKGKEEDNKLEFYFETVRKHFDWTLKEFKLNFIDSSDLREFIANKYSFDNKQRKILNLNIIDFKRLEFKNKPIKRWF